MMNIFKAISLGKKIEKAVKKSKKTIDSKKDLAEKIKKHLGVILDEVRELSKLLPEFKSVYIEILDIIDNIK